MTTIFGYIKPRGIGTNICKSYYDNKQEKCNPDCPFFIECKPFFENIQRKLIEITEDIIKRRQLQ